MLLSKLNIPEMNRYNYLEDNDNRRRGFWLSLILHIILLLLFLVPCFKGMKTKTEQPQGITVALGVPESVEKQKTLKASVPSSSSKNKKSTTRKTKPTRKSTSSKAIKSKTTEEKSSVIASNEDKAKKEKLRLEKAQKDAERAKAEEKARQEEKARIAKAEAERKAEQKSKAKSKFSSLFKGDNKESEDTKGSKTGKPDSAVLDSLTSGSGKIGTGLGSRELLHSPIIKDNTQKTGRVIVNICVGKNGRVMSAKFRQKGSTTTDAHLVSLAERSARKYEFSESSIEEQCGDIIIDFKLK